MIVVTERGWPGHFCAAQHCIFRRNTLIFDTCLKRGVVVSTIGNYYPLGLQKDGPTEVGYGRLYETMIFEAEEIYNNGEKYLDSDVSKTD